MNEVLYDDMVISEPGNLEPRRVVGAAIQCSWHINAAGDLSAYVRLDDMRAAGLLGNIKGYWLTYATSAGLWGGVISGQPSTGNYMEITAQGFLSLVKGRVITSRLVAMGGSAGGLALRALSQAGAGNPTYIALGDIDEGGGALSLELIGDVANDVLPQLAEAGDVEWIVTAERVFHLARRLGNDLSSVVRLVEDRHVVEARVNDDLEAVASGQVLRVQSELSQSVMSVTRRQAQSTTSNGSGGTTNSGVLQPPNNPAPPAPPPPPPLPPVWDTRSPGGISAGGWDFDGDEEGEWLAQMLEDWKGIPAGSRNTVVPQQVAPALAWQGQIQTYTIELPGVASTPDTNAAPVPWMGVAVGIGANNPAVASRRHVPPPTVPVELTLANVDDCFRAFDLGDTIRIDLGSIGVTGRFRAMTKALDVATQTLTVAGELLRDG